ncbi:hypothetical protein KD050_12160 [Psychrobacillus sp. INOP01]|uniref:hypothetical protein n=1 Tax=Psychrobacillus sp. INOP01 TaxID=2829187 RepID=UPI001BA65045|nr:hypothetical protein [Psychrobacillus sp. INOP01]QUG40070.1 hypothetical protein KD050_12160 [Psychrobacillus sp. INOP01]
MIWKVIVVLLIGLFTFSLNLDFLGQVVQISILPLGVWILYWSLRKNEPAWQKYRPFAWLGFVANYILLIFLLVGIPLNHLLYQGNNLSTYISNVEDAYIINTHPTANKSSLIKGNLIASIQDAKQQDYFSDSWYNETLIGPNKTTERFPYMLMNTLPKWGSGLSTTIYLEKNGKGILITTQEKQLYFQTENSLLEEAE